MIEKDLCWKAAICLLLMIALVSGCSENSPICDPYAVGAVEGYLLEAGNPVTGPIGLRALDGPRSGRVVAMTTTDSTGFYRLELPSGRYWFDLDPSLSSLVHRRVMPDTVQIGNTVEQHDVRRGLVEVRVSAPDDLAGQTLNLRLAGEGVNSVSGSADVVAGEALFRLHLVELGSYRMRVRIRGGAQLFLPAGISSTDGDLLAVDATTKTTYAADLRPYYASVSGAITGAWLQVTASATKMRVILVDEQSDNVASAECEDDGSYRCGVLLPKPVRIKSEYGYSNNLVRWVGGSDEASAQVFDLRAQDRLTGVDLVGSGIAITLNGPGEFQTHDPTYSLRDESGAQLDIPVYARLDALCNLAPGRYYLHVDGTCLDQPWAPVWFGGSEDFSGAAPIDLAAGELQEISLDLSEGGRIEGQLRDPDGVDLPNAAYRLFDLTGAPVCGSSLWGSRMLFRGLADGSYLVGGGTSDLAWSFYPGVDDPAAATPLVIADHAVLTNVNWRAPVADQEDAQ